MRPGVTKQYELVRKAEISPIARSGTSGVRGSAASMPHNGRKPVSAYQDALKTWQSQGGNQLRSFYEDIRQKYGTARES